MGRLGFRAPAFSISRMMASNGKAIVRGYVIGARQDADSHNLAILIYN
jgi:hypothetical protein